VLCVACCQWRSKNMTFIFGGQCLGKGLSQKTSSSNCWEVSPLDRQRRWPSIGYRLVSERLYTLSDNFTILDNEKKTSIKIHDMSQSVLGFTQTYLLNCLHNLYSPINCAVYKLNAYMCDYSWLQAYVQACIANLLKQAFPHLQE